MLYFTIRNTVLFYSFALDMKEQAKLDRFLVFLEKSGVEKFVPKEEGKPLGGRPGFNQYDMLATIIYAFAFNGGTLRDIASSCKFDIRFAYLMEMQTPSHMAFGSFIKRVIEPNSEAIFACLTKEIFRECRLDFSTCFIDGTKQEANCNKYKFVWRPTTLHLKLSDKIRAFLTRIGIADGIPSYGLISSMLVANKLSLVDEALRRQGLGADSIVIRRGIRHTISEKNHIELSGMLERLLAYEEKERICGKRNSYYKTDEDATAMCLKTDYYAGLGSSMHAAYSEQIIVSHGLIACYFVSSETSDSKAFFPAIDKFKKMYGTYPKSIGADAGYGTSGIYDYLAANKIEAFVKPMNWEGEVSGRMPWAFEMNGDGSIVCLGGKTGKPVSIPDRHPRLKEAVFYKVEDCFGCKFMACCRRFMKEPEGTEKIFEVRPRYQRQIQEARDLLLSPRGIEMRVNRSCQVEGSFGNVKQDMEYTRFRRRGRENVSAEYMLECLGCNIRKLFKSFEGKESFEYWKAPEGLAPEKMRKISAKRIANHVRKQKRKQPNDIAKEGYKYAGRNQKGAA